MSTDYIQRMETEHEELKDRLIKLIQFIDTQKFYELELEDQQALIEQRYAMSHYAEILGKRVARAKGWVKPRASVESVKVKGQA